MLVSSSNLNASNESRVVVLSTQGFFYWSALNVVIERLR